MTFFPRAERAFRTLSVSLLASAVVLGLPFAAHAQEKNTPKPEAEAYYGVYLQNAKIGSFVVKRDDNAIYNGKPAVRMDTTMAMDLRVMGAPNQIKNSTVSWSEPRTAKPLAQESRSEASGRITKVTATYTDSSLSYVANIQGTEKKETLKLLPGEQFLYDTSSNPDFKPKIGLKMKGKIFSPDLLKLIDSESEVTALETITVNGQALPAYKVVDRNLISPTVSYMNEAGDLLRMDSSMGIQVRKEPKELALAAPGGKDRPDIISLVGIRPTGAKMDKPRTTRKVTYEISGVTRPLPATDTVQSASYRQPAAGEAKDKNERIATVTVTANPLPTGPTVPLFKSVEAAPENLRKFLQSTPYVPANEPEFVELARTVVGTETDSAKAAAKIAAYVHETVKPDPSIAALRTAKDIKNDPRGVCRDYTTFYTSIARAAGLPTKQCVGIAYANGMFLYHAWPEVWVGGDKWVALEPTWGAPFADATHIKLAEGEILDILNISADMGSYRIKIIEVKP
jgi:hypothetical protein